MGKFILGVLAGCILLIIVINVLQIDPCEQPLPRTQRCVLRAVPESEGEHR